MCLFVFAALIRLPATLDGTISSSKEIIEAFVKKKYNK